MSLILNHMHYLLSSLLCFDKQSFLLQSCQHLPDLVNMFLAVVKGVIKCKK